MSQGDVLKVLKRKKKWMTSKEISACLNSSRGSVITNLNKLRNTDFIEYRIAEGSYKARYQYKYNDDG